MHHSISQMKHQLDKTCTVLHQVGVSFDLYYVNTPDDGRLRPKHVE